ncbi:MAG: YbhB/YbcL family Raf kinase inhibitor-like protein [Microvirga sp.]
MEYDVWRRQAGAWLVVMVAGIGAASAQTPGASQAPDAPFVLTSSDIKDGMTIERKYGGPNSAQMACGGENVSPGLQWSNAPASTKSFAVLMYDFDGGRGAGVVHWVAYGLAPDLKSLAVGEGNAASPRMTTGLNSRQLETYFGPCAPATDTPHHYIYSIYALDVPQDELPAKLTRDQFLEKVKGRVINLTSIVGTYRRP